MSEALRADDALSARTATHARVTLSDLQENIERIAYVNAAHAIGDPAFTGPLGLMTLCFIVTRSGFVVVGKSAPASPENFREATGRTFAYEDAMRQLWPLMGYALRERLAAR